MKPKVSVIIPTLGRETLYPLIDNLLKQETTFSYEIVLIPQIQLREERLKDKRIKLFYEPLGKGFAYYRNIGIEKSKGDILAFIDDDEIPMNLQWISTITDPIRKNLEQVVTAGVKIKLGQGYLTDSSSLLGFPGGGAIGFRTMWQVDKESYTEHLCSGNLSISRKTLDKIQNFSLKFTHGNEDVDLADKLINSGVRIKYDEGATVYHVARKGLINFTKWNFLRGKSAATYISHGKGKGKISNRLKSSKRIILKVSRNKPYYLPGLLFMMVNQYMGQAAGALVKK